MSGEWSKRELASTTCEIIVNCPNAITTSRGNQGTVSGGSYDLERLQLSGSSSRGRGAMIAFAEIRFVVKRKSLSLRVKHVMS